MEDYTQNEIKHSTRVSSYDEGLRNYMLKIYNYMTGGLIITGIVAFITANTPALLNVLYGTPLHFVVMFAPLGIVFYLAARYRKLSSSALQMWFWAFSVVIGLSISYIFLAYTPASIAKTFFITAGMFGGMSLFGYTTKKDLSGMGAFFYMGMWGVFLALIVNWFLQSDALGFAISVIGVVVFAGLTAWDTQHLKRIYREVSGDAEMMKKVSIMGALNLYICFINMFLFLLNMGGRD